MPAEAWQALFYVGAGLSAIFAVIYWCKVDRKDMDKLIEEIKGK
ncbi:putative membrane protein [Escherichia coli DEC9D]|nr:putative membrane protein [Escherichia coli DEC9D]